ncbi:hypothetical protein EAF04_000531 [Stromatinia cepivora]|nr:hypothetical protein EAF04_000531 [Stromatinia cepivora]
MPTRPDWLPIELQSLGNDGFTSEDIERCANLLRNVSNVGELSQDASNAKSKLDVEKSPQITGSPSTQPADGSTQRPPTTTHQRGLSSDPSYQARTLNNSGAAFDSAPPASAAVMANSFNADTRTTGLQQSSYVDRPSASVASTGFSHTNCCYKHHKGIAEGAVRGIKSSVSNGNSSSGTPSQPPSNFQNVTQNYNPATQAYGVQPVNTSKSSDASLSYTHGSNTFQNPPSASTIEQSRGTQNFANNYPVAANTPQARPNGTELGNGQSSSSAYKPQR